MFHQLSNFERKNRVYFIVSSRIPEVARFNGDDIVDRKILKMVFVSFKKYKNKWKYENVQNESEKKHNTNNTINQHKKYSYEAKMAIKANWF